jgi:hypothetical protein
MKTDLPRVLLGLLCQNETYLGAGLFVKIPMTPSGARRFTDARNIGMDLKSS